MEEVRPLWYVAVRVGFVDGKEVVLLLVVVVVDMFMLAARCGLG